VISSGRFRPSWLLCSWLALLIASPVPSGSATTPRKVPVSGTLYRIIRPNGTTHHIPPEAVADRLIVKLRPYVGPQHLQPLATQTASRIERVLPVSGMLVVKLPAGSDLQTAAAQFMARPEVEFAVPDTFVYPTRVPNDPKYDQQYHLPLVDAPQAWEVTTGSGSVVIAIIDSGCDLDHPDLAAKIWTNPGETPGNEVDDDGNGYVDDVHGWDFVNNDNDPNPEPDGEDNDSNGEVDEQVSHGTLAAGIAAAVTNDGWGTAGIDWSAKILPIQVFASDGGSPVSRVAEAIDYATAMGVNVINLSLGGGYAQGFSPPIKAAYQAGIVLVCAAGNSDTEFTDAESTWESPVCNDGPNVFSDNYMLGVTATDRYDQRTAYSNIDSSSANFVDVAAPGQAIYGPMFYDPKWPMFDTYWGTNSGTSFACPIVAGLAALLIANNPTITPAQVYEAIRNTTDNIDEANPGYAGKLGSGRINLARALGVSSAPRPVRELTAQDTPGDQGDSITITWLKSPDDGAGAASVTQYIVRRRLGATGAFQAIAQLPAGTEQHVDNTVTDRTDYYYQVRSSDGVLFSDSDIVGPVQSRDDCPPPSITTLSATDRPDDDGGAIVLTWYYQAPSDFSAYRIYRRTRDFNRVAELTPIVTIDEVATNTYIDSAITDGVDYYYAITAVDLVGNEETVVQTAGPVQSYPNGEANFAAGLAMLGTPAVPADQHPATLFGLLPTELEYARWDTANNCYIYYEGEPLTDFLRLALAQGFWIQFSHPVTAQLEGTTAPTGDFSLTLQPGWHQLANPFFGATDFGAATITYQGTTMDLLSADFQNIARSIAWVYDPDEGGYRMINADTAGSRLISPWQGFWMLVLKECMLTIPRPSPQPATAAHTQATTRARPPTEQGWSIRLVANRGQYQDRDNFCGVQPAPQITRIDNPPAIAGGVDLFFTESTSGRHLAASLRQHDATELEWDIVVRWDKPGGDIAMSWPNIDQLPRRYSATLRDLDGGATVNLRTRHCYRFGSDHPGIRHFHLQLTTIGQHPVTLTSVTTLGHRGGGQLIFVLSKPANCDIKIMNIAGRTIRTIEIGRTHPAGQNVVVWDGRNTTGSAVPNGRYLVEIQAAAEAGSVARALAAMTLLR